MIEATVGSRSSTYLLGESYRNLVSTLILSTRVLKQLLSQSKELSVPVEPFTGSKLWLMG